MKNKAINAIRVSVPNWKDDTAFGELTELLCANRACVQQIAFFSSAFHPPLPLDTAREHAQILRGRIGQLKEMGFSCGINVLSTVGHHPERMDEALHGPWRHMTDIDGNECEGSFCPGDERFREEYIAPLYRIFCAAKPDFIWVDDELRYGHLPIGNGCFCSGCIDRFNSENGSNYEIMWRSGGGAYTDRPLSELTEKAEQIGRQTARLPAYVTTVQSEIENFPYRVLQKSPRATALETLLYVR